MDPKSHKIVTIEDDDQIRTLVVTMLSAEGYTVIATGDPTEAVAIVRREAPDLVLCDIAMPVMDGYAVLKALQADPATARYPVVFLTAHREFSERVRAFRFGVVDYLAKPFSRKILIGKIERVLEGLARRSGVIAGGPEDLPLAGLLEEVQRDHRSGVLTLTAEAGSSRVVIRGGQVVEGQAPEETPSHVTFEELQPGLEEVVTNDPAEMPGTGPLPSFEVVPEVLRDVLIVDDNAAFRMFLGTALRQQGFSVHEAAEGAAGLREALLRRPWLIVTDVRMRGMDGFEFCRQVRTHSLLRQTPLLFLSGWDDYKARYQGLEVGADDFVSKGTPIRELLMRIHLLLKRYSDLRRRTGRGTALSGQLHVVGAPGLLEMCHQSRLTGTLLVQDGSREASVSFRVGQMVGAFCEGHRGSDAIYKFVAWPRGGFEFHEEPAEGEMLGETFDQLLLEACRRLDEQQRELGTGA